MQQLQAIQHLNVAQGVDHIDHLRRGEAEHTALAAGLGPFAADAAGEFHADAHARAYAECGRAFQNQVQFVGGFKNQDGLETHLERREREIDELSVFVAVADQKGFRIAHIGQRGDQFGLGPGLESMVIGGAERDHVMDRLLLLVDFDREDAAIDILVGVIRDRLLKRLVDQADAVAQQVAEPQQQRQAHAAVVQAVNDVREIDADRAGGIFQVDGREAVVRNRKVTLAPSADPIQFGAFYTVPAVQRIQQVL